MSAFDDTDWSRYLMGACSSGEVLRKAVERNREQVKQLRARVAELELQVREQAEVMREQGTELRHAEEDAYTSWCAGQDGPR